MSSGKDKFIKLLIKCLFSSKENIGEFIKINARIWVRQNWLEEIFALITQKSGGWHT